MSALQPAHYALSEAMLALVAVYAMCRLVRREPLAALALAPFGLAASIGAVRLALGIAGPVMELHQFVARIGGMFGMACLVLLLAGQGGWKVPLIGLGAAALALALPQVGQPLFIVLALAGTALAWRRAGRNAAFAALDFSLILIAQLVSAGLKAEHPALAWHLYHLIIALWVWCATRLFMAVRPKPA